MAAYSLHCTRYGNSLLTHSVTQIYVTTVYFLWSQATQKKKKNTYQITYI